MKICDNCRLEKNILILLDSEFGGGGVELCVHCHDNLSKKIKKINDRLAAIRDRARQRAFKELMSENPLPIRVQRARWAITALLLTLFSSSTKDES